MNLKLLTGHFIHLNNDLLTGIMACQSGQVWIQGVDLSARSAHKNSLAFDFQMPSMESREKIINGYLEKGLALPKSLSSSALYGKSNTLQLSIKWLKDEFVVSRTREFLQHRDFDGTKWRKQTYRPLWK